MACDNAHKMIHCQQYMQRDNVRMLITQVLCDDEHARRGHNSEKSGRRWVGTCLLLHSRLIVFWSLGKQHVCIRLGWTGRVGVIQEVLHAVTM